MPDAGDGGAESEIGELRVDSRHLFVECPQLFLDDLRGDRFLGLGNPQLNQQSPALGRQNPLLGFQVGIGRVHQYLRGRHPCAGINEFINETIALSVHHPEVLGFQDALDTTVVGDLDDPQEVDQRDHEAGTAEHRASPGALQFRTGE